MKTSQVTKKGFFLVLEGVDGAGKTTQIELLRKYLKDQKIPHEVMSFPRYGENLYADLVKDYLEGKFGEIRDVSPYLISLVYAGDRALAKNQIENWLQDGKVVIINRYVSSNIAHQGANLPEGERKKFFKWLDELEYKTNRIPKEDLTLLLNVNPNIGQRNAQKLHKSDIHENDLNHLIKANKIYLELAKNEKNWVIVNCMDNDKIRPIEDIHKDIVEIINGRILRN